MQTPIQQASDRMPDHLDLVVSVGRLLRARILDTRVFRNILDTLVEALPLSGAALYLIDAGTQQVLLAASTGERADMSASGRQFDRIHIESEQLMVPVAAEERPIGVLCGVCNSAIDVDNVTVRTLTVIADQIGMALTYDRRRKRATVAGRLLSAAGDRIRRDYERLVDRKRLTEIRDLTAVISNEMSSPVAAIVGNARMIELESALIPGDFSRRLEAIITGANRISRAAHKLTIVDRLLGDTRNTVSTQTSSTTQTSAGEYSC